MSVHPGSNLTQVKKNNLGAILRTIYNKGPITRNEIAKQLGVTIPTVTTTVKQLLEEGILQETTINETEVLLGRKATAIDFVEHAKYAIGIEWGPLGVLVCITNLRGELIVSKNKPIDKQSEEGQPVFVYDDFMVLTQVAVQEVITISKLERTQMIGVGFATPGIVDTATGTLIRSSMTGVNWKDKKIKQELEALLGFPVCVENHVRSRAIGQDMFSRKKRPDMYLYYFAQAGISSCIMIDGEPFGKNGGCTGDIGHTTMELDGPMCICGKKGCLQAFVGIPALVQKARNQMERAKDSILKKVCEDSNNPKAEEMARAIDAGDTDLAKVIYPALQYMGISISNIVNFLNTELVVIDCALLSSQSLRVRMDTIIEENHMFDEDLRIATEYVATNKYAGAQGACAVMIKEFLTGSVYL